MITSYDSTLLPAPDESERCAAHAERIELDPGGSALFVDELIVVDVPLPWPKPVWAKDGFTAVPELVMEAGEAGRRVRVLAAVPLGDGTGRVVTHRLEERSQFTRAEHHVAEGDVATLLERLLVDGLGASAATVVSRESVRELLLCTQGSHDICCGSLGMAMFTALAAANPDASIRRVSHTGGHRMAPTGVTLPDGRMWGMVGLDEMMAILDRTGSPAALTSRSRGWIGVAPGPEQMAERAVMAQVDDWAFDETPRTVSVVDHGASWQVEVTTDNGAWEVAVEAGRAVPTIACGEPGGLPAKAGNEWIVRSCEFRSAGAPR